MDESLTLKRKYSFRDRDNIIFVKVLCLHLTLSVALYLAFS